MDQIHLTGIHKDLLSRQGNGLSRHIGDLFPDLSNESAWLGGNGEAWERGPYYMDGLIPLAYLLKDDELITQANQWIASILLSQQDSGFFGPDKNHDWWPRAVVLKAMLSAYLATRNEDIIKFIENYLDYFLKQVDTLPFDFWGYARGMEGFETIDFIQNRLTSDKLEEIKKALKQNSMDWKGFFHDFPYPERTDQYMPKHLFRIVKYFTNVWDSLKKKRKHPPKTSKEKILKHRDNQNNLVFLKTHGVNIAMALKYLLYGGETPQAMWDGLSTVLKHHGNATGIFSSDEHLNGTSPFSGMELCTVVEMMYSMEEAIRMTGSMEACDRLEIYAYNALLTTIRPDFSSHQYVQQANQYDCEVKRHPFYDANRYANTFGVAPNYGCCAANMHQGWPKMMMSSVMTSPNTLGLFLYHSGIYRAEYPHGHIILEIQTTYPFADVVQITCIESTVDDIDWLLRIPHHAKTELRIQDQTIRIDHQDSYQIQGLKTGECVTLAFDFPVLTLTNPDHSISVQRGPLIYAQHIVYDEFFIKGEKPFHDRGFSPRNLKRISLRLEDGRVIVKSMRKTLNDNSFHDNDIVISVAGYDEDLDKRIDLELKPYGLSTLRRTHFNISTR